MEPAPVPASPVLNVRFYRPEDRAAVRRICAETGFLGKPIDVLFEDRDLFADYLTRYYTDKEPESTLVIEVDGKVSGYLTGSRHLKRYKMFRFRDNARLFLVGMWRYFTRPYGAATRQYVRWLLTRAGKENPHTPQGLPHFHINLLPEARSVAGTRGLIDAFLDYLRREGDTGVYGQMVTFDSRRGTRMFERYGFRVVDQVEVTKYKHLHEGGIFLFTIVKDLAANVSLYGKDLHKEKEGEQETEPVS
ncbi:MAG TPA: GNAT family acetyltransferase [Candidatus Methylacidiphilales bacterium]